MIHPLGYWWRRRAAKRQEERRRENRRQSLAPPALACGAATIDDIGSAEAVTRTHGRPRAWSSPEIRGRYRRVLEMRGAGLKFREIAGYIRIRNRPISAQRARQTYVAALEARKRGVI